MGMLTAKAIVLVRPFELDEDGVDEGVSDEADSVWIVADVLIDEIRTDDVIERLDAAVELADAAVRRTLASILCTKTADVADLQAGILPEVLPTWQYLLKTAWPKLAWAWSLQVLAIRELMKLSK
jgi:hypothetical protein